MKTHILYEDTHLFVIHKPAGIAVQSARVGQMDCESELRNYMAAKGQSPYIGVVHRLDQPVEGVLVVAKTREAAAKLNKQLATGSLNKKYLAVVHLEQEEPVPAGELVDFLQKDGQLARVVDKSVRDAKEARLRYRILQEKEGVAMVDVEIETGRFHQIRCQMAHHGMPLMGDAKYASAWTMERSRADGVRTVALCADRIAFKHPVTGQSMEFRVEPVNAAFAKFL